MPASIVSVVAPYPAPDPETGIVRAGEGLFLLPTLHQSVEFAVLVRRAFFALRPTAVAVELPQTIEEAFRKAVLRLPLLTVALWPDGDETVYLLVEPHEPMAEAARLALENGVSLHLVDRDDGSYPLRREALPDPYALTRIGAGPFVAAVLDAFPPSDDDTDLLRERAMAVRLARLVEAGERVLWVGGAAHVRGILRALGEPLAEPFGRVRREGVRIAALSPESSREVMSEIPYVSAAYERARSAGGAFAFDAQTDTLRVVDGLLREAAERYRKSRDEEVPRTAFRALRQFSRNLAILENVLTPGFYELVVAARGVVDDDYAWETFDLGATWPWPDTTASLPVVTLKGEDLHIEGRPVRFRRRFPGKERRLRDLPLRRRPKEPKPGDWRKLKFGDGICSHPPEDIAVERFGNRLRRRAIRLLSEESRRVAPFTTSLLDGVDVRESLRHHHEGRLWVYEEARVRGGAGSVVVIFDEEAEKYPWKTTWTGEHGQESDMAFYATPLGESVVGPGISECTYGGFLMTMPPGRLFDVWRDPDYRGPFTGAEVLLLAALDYAREPRVVYAAPKPPRPFLKRFAARLGKQVVYLPLGSLSSLSLKKLRRFHVLANRAARGWAKDYI
jgi:hypothetical protein